MIGNNIPTAQTQVSLPRPGFLTYDAASILMTLGETLSPAQKRTPPRFAANSHKDDPTQTYYRARYYSENDARFMSPDWTDATDPIPYADLSNPQTLNLYAYADNNPVSMSDPTGHYCQPDTARNTKTGVVVTAGSCTDPIGLDFILVGLAGGVGHHYIPQAFTRDWTGWQKYVVQKWTSGPLIKGARANLNDEIQRLNNAAVEKIVEKYLAKTGKSISQLTKEDFQAIANEIKNAGGEIEQFNTRLMAENPHARDVEAALEHALQKAGSAAQEGGQVIQEGAADAQQAAQEAGPYIGE